jgi:hypothetical protein
MGARTTSLNWGFIDWLSLPVPVSGKSGPLFHPLRPAGGRAATLSKKGAEGHRQCENQQSDVDGGGGGFILSIGSNGKGGQRTIVDGTAPGDV